MNQQHKTSWETCLAHGYRQFVVVNLDFLGQREKLKALSAYAITDMCKPETTKLQVGTFKAVATVRDSLDRWLSSPSLPASLAHPGEGAGAVLRELTDMAIVSQSFSDTLAYHVCLDNDPYKPSASIFEMLVAVSQAMLVGLATGLPLRGGVEFSWAANLTDSEIYGPAPYGAYYLEHDVAQYPRIVVSERVLDYLDAISKRKNDGMREQIACSFAEHALGLLSNDQDGKLILDYLGEGTRRILTDDIRRSVAKSILPQAYDFIIRSHDEFTRRNDEKHIERYTNLKAYFDRKMDLWRKDGFDGPT